MIKYIMNQADSPTSKVFPTKIVAIFSELTEIINTTSLNPTHVLVQDVDSPTLIKDQLKSHLSSRYTLGHKKMQ